MTIRNTARKNARKKTMRYLAAKRTMAFFMLLALMLGIAALGATSTIRMRSRDARR
jgi:branched-subunit amino acid permease